MNKYLPRKITDIKGKVALAELQRTHIIVFVLSIMVIALVLFIFMNFVEVNAILVTVAIVLLALLGLMSLSTAIGLSKLIKK